MLFFHSLSEFVYSHTEYDLSWLTNAEIAHWYVMFKYQHGQENYHARINNFMLRNALTLLRYNQMPSAVLARRS